MHFQMTLMVASRLQYLVVEVGRDGGGEGWRWGVVEVGSEKKGMEGRKMRWGERGGIYRKKGEVGCVHGGEEDGRGEG